MDTRGVAEGLATGGIVADVLTGRSRARMTSRALEAVHFGALGALGGVAMETTPARAWTASSVVTWERTSRRDGLGTHRWEKGRCEMETRPNQQQKLLVLTSLRSEEGFGKKLMRCRMTE